jgi:voltage-gated potassium channel
MRWIERAVRSNRIVLYLGGATFVLSLMGGVVMRLLNPDSFSSVGIGVWWALQTVTTVGYGDVVPGNGWGKFVGGIVMILGVTFLSLLTALVTSALVTGEQRRRQASEDSGHPPVHESLARIEARLEAIEQKLV